MQRDASYAEYARQLFSKRFDSPDGSFVLPDISDSTCFLRVTAGGYSTQVVQVNCYLEGESPSREIALESESSVSGTVYDLYTQAPIWGARVYCNQKVLGSAVDRWIPIAVMSDKLGRYRLGGLPSGSHRIFASHPDYSLAVSDEIQLIQKGASYTGLNFSLGAGGTIEGTVTGPSGPVKDARIYFAPVDSSRLITRLNGAFENRYMGRRLGANTGENGYYRKEGLSPGYWRVRTSIRTDSDEYVPNSEIIQVHEGKNILHNIAFCEGGTIEANILADKSHTKEYPYIYIYLRPYGAPPIALNAEGQATLEDPIRMDVYSQWRGWSEQGFRFSRVCPGKYTVTVWIGRFTRGGDETYDQISVPATVRLNRTTPVNIDFRR